MKKALWERLAFLYDIVMKKGVLEDRAAADYIARFLTPDCRLLEAACGTGRFSRARDTRYVGRKFPKRRDPRDPGYGNGDLVMMHPQQFWALAEQFLERGDSVERP